MTKAAIFISKASIFLPRYSGVRPTISPAMNTAMMAKTNMPYSPLPTPPKMTSPSCMSHIGINPPSGVKESCMELTLPLVAAVVAVAQIADWAMPKRSSLPSMFPPGCESQACLIDAQCGQCGIARLLGPIIQQATAARKSPTWPPEWPSLAACRRPSAPNV